MTLLVFGRGSSLFAGNHDVDPREVAIDLAVGGMEEGSRPLSPEAGESQIPGSGLSPGMDTRVTASATGPGASVVNPADGGVSDSGSGGQQEPVFEATGGANDPDIVDLDAGANLGGGSPSVDADVTVTPDAGGEILDADTTTTGPDDTGVTVGANLDDTASGLEGSTALETGPSEEGVSEPMSATSDDRSIIEADASVDTTGGSPVVDADASIDTSAEGGLVDADVTTSADVVDQELTSDSGLEVDLTADTTIAESSLGNEIGRSPAPPATEADVGLEAAVEATGSGDDVASDPVDGLSSDLPSI